MFTAPSDEISQAPSGEGFTAPADEIVDSSPQWSDIPGNIVKGIKEAPKTLGNIAKNLATPWPVRVFNSVIEGAATRNPLTAIRDTLPGAALNLAKDYGGGELVHGDVPGALEHAKKTTIEHPIQTGVNAASVVAPFLAPEAEDLNMVRTDAAERSARLAQEQSVKSLEGAMGQVRQIGPQRARELGQAALDEGVVSPFTPTTLGMERKLAKFGQDSGEAVGAGRAAGDVAGGAPDINLLKNNAEATLTPDYETGMRAGQTGALKNAIDEIPKIKGPAGQEPGFSDIADKATEMNKFAAKNKMLQPEGPTTDVANFLSRENNAALQKALTPEQWTAYKKALGDYSTFEDIKKFFVRGEERQMAGRGSGFTTDIYKGFKDVAGHKGLAWGADKFAKFLQSPAVAKAMPALSAAAKQGPAALATTHYLLKEHNKGYADAAQ